MTFPSDPVWHIARGCFSNSYVAIYQTDDRTYYGYGKTEEEAMRDALAQIPPTKENHD